MTPDSPVHGLYPNLPDFVIHSTALRNQRRIVSAREAHWPPEVLTAFWQERAASTATVALRGVPAVTAAATLRKVLATVDAEAPVSGTATMDELLSRSAWAVHLFATMFVIFGVVSLVIAGVGRCRPVTRRCTRS